MTNTPRTAAPRRRNTPRRGLAALAALGLCAALPQSARAQTYAVTDLGFTPVGITGAGVIAGNAGAGGLLWTPTTPNGTAGTSQSLGSLPGANTAYASGVSETGYVVGTARGADSDRAFVWSAALGMRAVALPPGCPQSYGYGVNSAGVVTGSAGDFRIGYSSNNTLMRAFTSGPSGVRDLGTLPQPQPAGGLPPTSYTTGINDSGQVTGYTNVSLGTRSGSTLGRACYWTPDGTVVSLDLPPDPSNPNADSYAGAINRSGQIIGSYTLFGTSAPGTTGSFLWTPGVGPRFLSSPVGTGGGARALNDAGVMVGAALVGGTQFSPLRHALLYQGTVGVDLNTLISAGSDWTLNEATGINSSGEIIGNGTRLIGGQLVSRGFLLTPTPEPSACAVLALGALGLGGLTLRARKRRA